MHLSIDESARVCVCVCVCVCVRVRVRVCVCVCALENNVNPNNPSSMVYKQTALIRHYRIFRKERCACVWCSIPCTHWEHSIKLMCVWRI